MEKILYFAPNLMIRFGAEFLAAMGCEKHFAMQTANHLVGADLAGVASHGIFRLTQYMQQANDAILNTSGKVTLQKSEGGADVVDGGNNLGIVAMDTAISLATECAKNSGVGIMAARNLAHTGRIGAFAEKAANQGCLAIILGGGSRHDYPQVAPYGGAKGMLPTNPYAFAIPAGNTGPVVLDFATSAGAGGKIYAAKAAKQNLPEGLLIDKSGNSSIDPDDYFNGGAILPMAGPKGYGMALIAELLGNAIYGQSMSGMNWICIAIDLSNYRAADQYKKAAKECLDDLRNTPPAPNFEQVEIPGERERTLAEKYKEIGIPLPFETVKELQKSAQYLDIETDFLNKALNVPTP